MSIHERAHLAYVKALRGEKLTAEEIETIVAAIKLKQLEQ